MPLKVNGLSNFIAQAQQWTQRAADISAPVVRRNIGLAIQADVDQRFASAPRGASGGVVYGGATWNKLSEAYLKARPDRATGQILRDTGQLAQSLQVGGRSNILTGTKKSVFFGTSLPKAAGLNRKRQIIVVHQPLIDSLKRVVILWVLEGR